MAKQNKKSQLQDSDSNKEVEEVKVVDAETVKPSVKKSKLPTKDYTLKVSVKVSGVWKKKGDKISLTEQGYRFFRSKKYV